GNRLLARIDELEPAFTAGQVPVADGSRDVRSCRGERHYRRVALPGSGRWDTEQRRENAPRPLLLHLDDGAALVLLEHLEFVLAWREGHTGQLDGFRDPKRRPIRFGRLRGSRARQQQHTCEESCEQPHLYALRHTTTTVPQRPARRRLTRSRHGCG